MKRTLISGALWLGLLGTTLTQVPDNLVMAKDEGHGFAKKKNADFQFLATILFFREHLLK